MKKALDPIKELKRELTALKKKVASLERQLANTETRSDIVCASLTVVNSRRKTVAKIDRNGFFICRDMTVSANPDKRGIVLDGKNNAVQCERFAIVGPKASTQLIEMSGTEGASQIVLRDTDKNVAARIVAFRSQGGCVELKDARGTNSILLLANTSAGEIQMNRMTERRIFLTSDDGKVASRISTFDHGVTTGTLPPIGQD